MDESPKLTPQTALVLDVLLSTPGLAGADISKQTGLLSGTLYPILLRLERAGWLTSEWEAVEAQELKRPRRRFYRVTGRGAAYAREQARTQMKAIRRLAWE